VLYSLDIYSLVYCLIKVAILDCMCLNCCRSVLPVWEELLVFNENYNYFIQDKPKVLLVFEVRVHFLIYLLCLAPVLLMNVNICLNSFNVKQNTCRKYRKKVRKD